jgi:hypothetical protein
MFDSTIILAYAVRGKLMLVRPLAPPSCPHAAHLSRSAVNRHAGGGRACGPS